MPTDERHIRANDGHAAIPPAAAGGTALNISASSWAEQDEVLRTMWLAGEPPPQIAEKLSRSVAAIMTRAARLGLPRRFAPGRKPTARRNFLPQQPRSVPARRPAQEEAAADGTENRPTTERICLMCLVKFPSLGAHNRICASCKESNSYLAGSRLPDLDFPI